MGARSQYSRRAVPCIVVVVGMEPVRRKATGGRALGGPGGRACSQIVVSYPTWPKRVQCQVMVPPIPHRVFRGRHVVAAVGLAVAMMAQALSFGYHHSLTWDEPSYIAAGNAQLRRGDFSLNPSHPPLIQQLYALGLQVLDIPEPPGDARRFARAQNPVVAYGGALLFQPKNNIKSIAFGARLPVVVLAGLLVVVIFLWGRSLFGAGPALWACAVAALSPNLVAHGSLATEDFACAVWMLCTVAALDRAMRRQTAGAWLLVGAVTGLALATKYTSLLLGPVALVLWAVELRWAMRRGNRLRFWPWFGGPLVAVSAAYLVLVIAYHGDLSLRPYVFGLTQIYADKAPGPYAFYLMGRGSSDPWWYYYLAALAFKVPLPTLALWAWGLTAALLSARRRAPDETRSHARAALVLGVPVVVILGVTCFDRANLGLRRVLPALPFLALFVASAAAGPPHRLRRPALFALLALLAVQNARAYPHYLSFFNTAAKGPQNGPMLLDDSNIDWGQDLPALARAGNKNATKKQLISNTSEHRTRDTTAWTPCPGFPNRPRWPPPAPAPTP